MVENIKLSNSNFCIGPQSGTYCSINTAASPVTMQVKNSSGTLIRTYVFTPSDTLKTAPYIYSSSESYIAGQVMAAKTFIFDLADNYGDTAFMGLRSIEFYDEAGSLILLPIDTFSAYATSYYSSSYLPSNVFNTSLSKINTASSTSWLSSSGKVTNQRLICKFNTVKYIKTVVINNHHSSGADTARGVRNLKIYFSEIDYIDTTYGSLSSFHKIFSSSLNIHTSSNIVHDQTLVLESETVLDGISGEPVALSYVGPLNRASVYNNAIFYTLECVPNGYRTYYTYARDEDTGEYVANYYGDLDTSKEVEYYGNIIRKWRINNTTFTLDLVSSFYKTSNTLDWFGAQTFAIQTYESELLDHVSSGTGVVYFTTTSGLSKYDTVLIGPSSDMDNVSAVEEVYIYSIDESTNAVTIRTYSGATPTIYEYVEGDPITVIKYAHLPSKPRPLLDSDNVRYAFDSTGGTLFTADLNSYGDIVARTYSAIFSDVAAACWNSEYDTVSFIKGVNLLHYSLLQDKTIKSQYLLNVYDDTDEPEVVPIYDIVFNGTDLYRLQKAVLTFDSTGKQTLTEYTTYNYFVDTLEVYSSVITVYASNTVVGYQGSSIITAVVRDQFGVGLLDREVSFSIAGDDTGVLEPPDGNVVTNSDGVCFVQYTTGANTAGLVIISAKVSGANSGFGSAYIVGSVSITSVPNHTNLALIRSYIDEYITTTNVIDIELQPSGSSPILCFVRRTFPGGEWQWVGAWPDELYPTIESRNEIKDNVTHVAFLMCVYQPFFNSISTDDEGGFLDSPTRVLPVTKVRQFDVETTLSLPSEASPYDSRYLSQNYLSRHLSSGNVVTTTLNQFVFTQEAIPAFWSEKNTPSIDYWIRLRPYAYSLAPNTLEIYVYSVYYGGTTDIINIAHLGTITTFDAGSGLEGIDFTYTFPENFHNNATVFVEVVVYDQAPNPNLITVSYWFKIVPDYTKPYIINRVPDLEAFDVGIDTCVTFDVLDKGEGVDISTLEVFINNRQVPYSYIEYESGQFHITCVVDRQFVYGQVVKVEVSVSDRSDNRNVFLESWSFYCINSTGPWFDEDNVFPGRCLQGLPRAMSDVSVQVFGINDTGVDYSSLRLDVGGKYRNIKITPIIYRLR